MVDREVTFQTANLKTYQEAINANLHKISELNIMTRIWKKDYSIWKDEDKEISNRLGWLTSPRDMMKTLSEIESLVQGIKADGYTHALLLGMGGSSLASEVLSKVFGSAKDFLELAILDTTDPGAIINLTQKLSPERTLFIVSSKSGTTVETLSLFKYFYNWLCDSLGREKAGAHFIAITDPDTPLEQLASQYHFRSLIASNPDIGGRFSALSAFGLVPGALIGTKIHSLLERSEEMVELCHQFHPPQDNPGGFLGTVIATLALSGRDKATFILSPRIESFSSWLEQLLAESTGKERKGILPIVREPVFSPNVYGDDRFFIHICLKGDKTHNALLTSLKESRQPYLGLTLHDTYSLGGQFFLWEMATAVAGFFLGINPFDQPNVIQSKKKASEFITAYRKKRVFPAEKPTLFENEISLFSDRVSPTIEKGLKDFLNEGKPGDYVAIQAFLQPTSEIAQLLQKFRIRIRNLTKLAATTGFGPRYLHSTGQLHKGDKGNGLFIQLIDDESEDALIPDKAGSSQAFLSFGILKKAQARGDFVALIEAKRRVMRLHLGKNVVSGLKKIISLV